MTARQLTDAETKKLKQLIGRVQGLPKTEQGRKDVERFADKYLRFKLGVRGTGPHSHGLSDTQRKALREAIHKAFGIKAPERKAPAKAPAKASGKKAPSKAKAPAKRTAPVVPQPGTGVRSTSELAGAQQARAAQS